MLKTTEYLIKNLSIIQLQEDRTLQSLFLIQICNALHAYKNKYTYIKEAYVDTICTAPH